jgi:hypothetical protein
MGERFIRVGDIAFDIALAPVARVGPRKKAFFEDLTRLRIEPGPQRILGNCGLCRARTLGGRVELGIELRRYS